MKSSASMYESSGSQFFRTTRTLTGNSDNVVLLVSVGLICIGALDIYAPKKYLRANSSLFMNKAVSNAVMDRTRLRNKFLKNRSAENKLAYNR